MTPAAASEKETLWGGCDLLKRRGEGMRGRGGLAGIIVKGGEPEEAALGIDLCARRPRLEQESEAVFLLEGAKAEGVAFR